MKEQLKLKFPKGIFSHSDLARFNNRTNQQIWIAYQESIKNGIIVSQGERKGKGKPTRLWAVSKPEYASDEPVSIPAPAQKVQAEPRIHREPKPVKVKKVTPDEVVSVVEKQQEVVAASPTPTEPKVLENEVEPVIKASASRERRNVRETKFACPVCGVPMIAWDDDTGVMVYCGQPINICKSTENVYGHSNTENNAYKIACEKWKHVSKF